MKHFYMTSDPRGICAVMHLLVLLQNVASDEMLFYITLVFMTSLTYVDKTPHC